MLLNDRPSDRDDDGDGTATQIANPRSVNTAVRQPATPPTASTREYGRTRCIGRWRQPNASL